MGASSFAEIADVQSVPRQLPDGKSEDSSNPGKYVNAERKIRCDILATNTYPITVLA